MTTYQLMTQVGPAADHALQDLAQFHPAAGEHRDNKSALINRALVVWATLCRLEQEGGEVYVRDPGANVMRKISTW